MANQNNPGSFRNDRQRAAQAGQKGGARKGGRNSHQGSSR